MPVRERKLEADRRAGPRGAGWGVLGQRQEEGSYSLRPHLLNSGAMASPAVWGLREG